MAQDLKCHDSVVNGYITEKRRKELFRSLYFVNTTTINMRRTGRRHVGFHRLFLPPLPENHWLA
jgi:hypothetical protein